ncbi:MAG: hypothetical protein ACRECH_09390 [Nitrososphaerales archaeon]
MPKWKKDETEFTVSLGYNEVKGYWCTIPKPIVKLLGEPEKVTFEVKPSKKVEVKGESLN